MEEYIEIPPDLTKTTDGVKTLLGNPREAIFKLAVPMIVAFAVQNLYNFADAFWVSGLGPDALSAIGFFFPFFFMISSVAAGLGIGGSAALSRRIGARDKAGADRVASHTLMITGVIGLVLTVPCAVVSEPLFRLVERAGSRPWPSLTAASCSPPASFSSPSRRAPFCAARAM